MATASRPRLVRGWHCVYDMHYHLVFTVKYRRALLDPQVVAELTRISREIQERYEFQIETLGADSDHVHLLCAAHPKVAAGQIARIYKSLSARELFKALPSLRKQLWGGAFWTSSYFAATVGQFGGYESVRRYVEEQGHRPEDWNLWLEFPPPTDE
ncbi:MAG: IS200/IS605 family transposase [Armatimonadetes bacterium]|nr:IS200/IS605 family transposase [Armatimonadota bacterium]